MYEAISYSATTQDRLQEAAEMQRSANPSVQQLPLIIQQIPEHRHAERM